MRCGSFSRLSKIAPDSARDKLNYALALLRVEGREPEAVKLLEEVKRQDPSLPHTWFNLGIYYKRQGDANRAIAQFEGMIARAPEEPIGHYQLGTLYQQQKRNAAAQRNSKPRWPRPAAGGGAVSAVHLYRLAGNAAQANRYLAEFQDLQKLQKTWVIPEDSAWCSYAEIYDPPSARAQAPALPEAR